MAIYYFKGAVIETPFNVSSDRFHYETTSLGLKRQITTTEAQRWLLDFNVKQSPYSGSEADMFVDLVKNPFGVQTMVMPQLPSVDRAMVVSKAAVGVAAVAGSETISLTRTMPGGETSGAANQVYPKGMFFRFANHPKVYLITETVSWGSSTQRDIKIFPKLTRNVSVNTKLHLASSCLFTYTRDSATLSGLSFADGIISSPGTVSLIENI